MPASNHTLVGSVEAIQYTGTNLAEIETALGSNWSAFGSDTSTTAAFCQKNGEMFMTSFLAHPGDWLVSQVAYGNTTPALNAGFSIVPNNQFTQGYSAQG